MTQNPPARTQRVVPYLMYADASAAIDFLCQAFGFEERFRMPLEDGGIQHAELGFKDNALMLASVREAIGTASPKDLGARHAITLCYVDDVDAHYEKSKAAGAKILSEPADQPYGERTYCAEDPEGHQWYFHFHFKDMSPDELNAAKS